MKLFENVSCELCGSDENVELYVSYQYANIHLKNIQVNIVLCKYCHFIYQNPQLTDAAITLHYETSSSGDTFKLHHEGSRSGKLIRERLDILDEVIRDNAINSICDVGGGTGELIKNINISGSTKKYLIEPSSAIDKCINKNIIKMKIPILELSSDYFSKKLDLILCVSVLEHLKNPLLIMQKFNNLLSDNGFLFIEVPNSLKPNAQFAEFYSYEHINHFTMDSLRNILRKSGFYPIIERESNSVSSIRVIAKKCKNSAVVDFILSQDKTRADQNKISTVFKNYSKEKENLISKLVQKIKYNIYKRNITKLAIYGAGEHTRFILDTMNINSIITNFIDSDPKKWNKNFLGKEIIGPDDIVAYKISDILISSHDFENEIYETIKKIDPSINIITLYRI